MFQAKCVCFYKLGYTEIGPHAKLKCTSQGMFGVPARFTFIFSVCITLCTSLAGLVTPYMGFCLRGEHPMQRLYVRLVGNQRGDLISFTSQREKDEKIKLKTPTKQFVLSFKNHTDIKQP